MTVKAGSSLRDICRAFAETGRCRRLEARDLRADYLWDEAAVRGVALMTKEWRSHLQHAFHDCTVRVVAVRAILADGLVVMHEWSAFFGVALVAGIDQAIALHQFRRD